MISVICKLFFKIFTSIAIVVYVLFDDNKIVLLFVDIYICIRFFLTKISHSKVSSIRRKLKKNLTKPDTRLYQLIERMEHKCTCHVPGLDTVKVKVLHLNVYVCSSNQV